MQTEATYFDGETAYAHPARLWQQGDIIEVRLQSQSFTIRLDNTQIVPPVGGGEWKLEIDDFKSLVFVDDDFGRQLLTDAGKDDLVGNLERSWRWAAVTLVIAVVATWGILTYGVPVAAKGIAYSVPAELDRELGEQSINLLDRVLFESSQLDSNRENEIRALFSDVAKNATRGENYRLEFRSSPRIGANAFAIPGGLVVMTDEMVDLAVSDAEIVAVLAHEVGHLEYRHSLRILLQNSVSAIIIAGLTGDLSNITALSATIPTVLMQAKYSRDFESEADQYAFEYLQEQGIDANVLSDLLLRLDTSNDDVANTSVSTWLSSHPRSGDRRPDKQDAP